VDVNCIFKIEALVNLNKKDTITPTHIREHYVIIVVPCLLKFTRFPILNKIIANAIFFTNKARYTNT
jgi:hypothetical protein